MRLRESGVTLIEVLFAVVVTAIGLLGMVSLQMRAYASESESYQRAQAAVLLEDMANRIRTNGGNASAYVAQNIGVGAAQQCDGSASVAAHDLCEWSNLLRGAAETKDGARVGAMAAGRSCIVNPSSNLYVITIVWEGTVPSAAPAATCGQGEFGDERVRRALSTVVRIADLDS